MNELLMSYSSNLNADQNTILAEYKKSYSLHRMTLLQLEARLKLLTSVYAKLVDNIDKPPLKEYPLIKELINDGDMLWHENTQVALFQKHFALFNFLHFINTHSNVIQLEISALNIVVLAKLNASSDNSDRLDTSVPQLSLFYLDWVHFEQATPDSVNTLLTSFWERYQAHDTRTVDLQILGIDSGNNISWEDIKKAYQRCASKAHPDKGGETKKFVMYKDAYERLKKYYVL